MRTTAARPEGKLYAMIEKKELVKANPEREFWSNLVAMKRNR